jgi:hypothetical protein
MIGLPFQTVLIILIVCLGIGLGIGLTLIVSDLVGRRRVKRLQHTMTKQETFQYLQEPSFEAQIIKRKQRYIRGKGIVSFRSRFKGKLTNGFFANQIFTPEVVNGTTVHVDYFDATTPNVAPDKRSAISPCTDTLEYWEAEGKLHGDVDTDWKEWSWEIPEYAPLGRYRVKMMVWNTFTGNVKEPYRTIEDTFEVIEPDDSHYRRFDSINIGDRPSVE